MPFGIGGSTSESRTDSSSFDNLDQSSFDIGGSSQQIAFEDLFRDLFGGASVAASGINTGGLASAAQGLFSSGGGFLESLESGGAGGEFLRDRLGRSDEIVGEQVGVLGTDIEKFLTESVLPNINQTGISAGTFGGTRGGVARGLAGEAAISEFARGSTDIRARERGATDAIATSLLQSTNQAAGVGLGGLSDVLGLAESGAFAGLSPFAALAQILGDPTVLGESFDLGGSRTTGRAGSQSTSTSEGRSFRLGLG